jgi:hypothetical protein
LVCKTSFIMFLSVEHRNFVVFVYVTRAVSTRQKIEFFVYWTVCGVS